MRVALCLSGQPRTWRRTRESLLAFFAGHAVEVFFHTWDEGDPAEHAALVDAYRPRAHAFGERPLFLAEKRLMAQRFPKRPPLTILDMFHSVAESLALAAAEGDGTYDLVVRARFDALFDGRWSGELPAAGELILPDAYPDPSGCNDQFAIGRPADMWTYAAAGGWIGANLSRLASTDGWLRPEALLLHYLRSASGLAVALRPVAMRLCRDDQAHLPFARLGDDPLFQAAKHEEWEAFARTYFPDVAARADFDHPSRQPLALDRALGAWVEARGERVAHDLFKAPWPRRIKAIDAMLDEQTGGLRDLDEGTYQAVRMICAALLQRMDDGEALTLQSAALHLLSDNFRDMQRVYDWSQERPGGLERALAAAPAGGLLAHALSYKPPLTASGHDTWRRRA
jgi:hypothetical protein